MEDIFVPPESEANKPRGRGGTGSVSPFEDPPPDISVTSDKATPSGVPSTPGETPSRDLNPGGIPNSERFPPGSSQFQVFPYDPDPFPPFWMFASSELTPASSPDEDESMDVGDHVRDSTAPVIDGGADDVVNDEGEEKDEEESEGVEDGEEDWSLATSGDQWQLVSENRQDGHSTPSGFVLASEGTPSIPDDLMSFSTDQDEASSDEDDVSSVQDDVPSDQCDVSFFQDNVSSYQDEMSFYDYPDDALSGFGVLGRGNSTAVKSKILSLGHLTREDTLEEETDGSEHRMSYDLNDNEECTTPLGDPLLSSIVFGIKEDRTETEDIYHDTEDGDEDMETPRAPSIDHINNVTGLHRWCSSSYNDSDMAAKVCASTGLHLSNVPHPDLLETHPLTESLQEESFFDSGNFQRVDDVYECYPAKIQSRKRSRPIGTTPHPKFWFKGFSRRQPKRGKAKRKSKDRRRWKLDDHLTDTYLC